MIRDEMWNLPPERLLRPREVATLFDVSVKTVGRWARDGRLPYIRTVGGHRRFPVRTVQHLLRVSAPPDG